MVMTPLEKMYLWFLFFAYTALFLIMFGFLYKMLNKSRQLDREVRRLKEAWAEQESAVHGDKSVTPTVHRH